VATFHTAWDSESGFNFFNSIIPLFQETFNKVRAVIFVSKIGTELKVLEDASFKELENITDKNIAKAIINVRQGKVEIIPGYDGIFGNIKVISNNNNSSVGVLLGGTLVVNGYRSETITSSIAGDGITKIQGILTDNLESGEIKGLLNMQDITIPKYMQDLDTLAASLIREVNNIHSEGVGLNGGFTSLTSTNAVNNATDSLASTGLPFAPSVTTYTTGTITSAGSTVTGAGTSFTSNVKANDWIKLNDGNRYKVVSVDSDTQLTISGSYTDAASISTNITNGSLYVTITNDSTDEITKTSISIASDETLNSLAAKLDGITNLNASVGGNFLTITSDSGYKYSFTKALDTNPGDIGASAVTISGNYSGNDNDIYTLNVQDAGTGSIGTGSAVIRVTDATGAVVADLDVGSSYTVGSVLQIADGVSISFGSGAIVVGQELTFDVTNDPDTSNVLTALGINTFFAGKDASTIAVTQYIKNDVTRIAAASTASQGDNTNALRLINLQNIASTNNATFSDFLHSTVAQLGIETAEKAREKESFNSLLTNLENRRQEVAGVSIDEEMINVIRFQQAFQASARFISVISEMSNVLMQI